LSRSSLPHLSESRSVSQSSGRYRGTPTLHLPPGRITISWNVARETAMPTIRIDRGKPLAAEPRKGHNRYHPDIEPALEAGIDEEVVLECRDALDGQITPSTTVAGLATVNAGAVHPLTGPVFVKGAEPGDML